MMFAFFTPGPMELVIVGIIGVLLFGSQLPKMMRNLGKAIPEFKKGLREIDEIDDDIRNEINKA